MIRPSSGELHPRRLSQSKDKPNAPTPQQQQLPHEQKQPRNPLIPRGKETAKPPAPVMVPTEPWGARGTGRTVTLTSVGFDANEGYRQYMEDGSKIVDPFPIRGGDRELWGYFAVYDGHGGRQAVDYCEAKLHDIV